MPKALKTLEAVSALMPAYIISTSYTPYLRALCELAGFPMDHVRCTELSLDAWDMPEDEAAWLRSAVSLVLARPVIEIPDGAAPPPTSRSRTSARWRSWTTSSGAGWRAR